MEPELCTALPSASHAAALCPPQPEPLHDQLQVSRLCHDCPPAHSLFQTCLCGRDTEQPGGTLRMPMAASSQPRPPEELLAVLLEACRCDTAGGMHFWEVARSLRCA